MKQHERIWLQTLSEATGETTWCEDKINDDDVEYVHGDLFAQLEAELEMYERDETFGTLAIQLAKLEAEIAEADEADMEVRKEVAQLEAELDECRGALAEWMKVHDDRIDELEAENEGLDKRWARHYRSLAEDLALAYDTKRELWREYIPETIANEIDALLTEEH